MGTARFFVERRKNQRGSFRYSSSAVPVGLKDTFWFVAPEYWIGDIAEGSMGHKQIDNYSGVLFNESIFDSSSKTFWNQKLILEPGKYIFCETNPRKATRYNPMNQTDLFINLAAIGGKPYNENLIINFVSQYGHIAFVSYGRFNVFPCSDFYKYAQEAHFTLLLSSALAANDFKSLISNSNKLVNLYDKKNIALNFIELLRDWCYFFPNIIGGKINEIIDLIDNHFEADNSAIEIWDTYWGNKEIILEDVFIEFAAEIIERIGSQRICNITPVLECNATEKSGIKFNPRWRSDSLLGVMWLQFYLKITNQLEVSYKICPECDEAIVDPRKNQIYHDKCRKAVYIRTRRLAEKLWKEGNSIKDIISETGAKEDRIMQWIGKLPKE